MNDSLEPAVEMTRVPAVLLVLIASLGVGGCDAIVDIFQAGLWVGVIIVLIVLALLFWVINKFRH